MIKFKFTLIELLLVVAIIGILASLLMPSLSKARDRAKTAVCKSNQKQIGLAAATYPDDHDGVLVMAGHSWINILGSENYLSAPRVSAFNNTLTVDDINMNSIFYCPTGLSDQLSQHAISGNWDYADENHTHRAWRSNNTSYGLGGYDSWYGVVGAAGENGSATDDWRLNTWRPDGADQDWPTINRLAFTSKSLMAHDGTHHMHTFKGTGGRIAARHNSRKSLNGLFYDGHVMNYSFSTFNATKLNTPDNGSEIIWRGSQRN